MSKIKTITLKHSKFIIIVFISLGLILLAFTAFRKRSYPKSKPFTLVSACYEVGNDGKPVLQSISTKFVRNSGVWKEITVNKKTEEAHQRITKDGSLYDVINGKLQWLSTIAPEDEPIVPPTEYFADVVRTEKLFGLTVYVTHMDMGRDGFEEEWHTLETGRIPIKTHMSLHGGKSQVINEPISLTFGDIPDSLLESPDLPISYDYIHTILRAAEKAGHHEFVDQTKATIEEEKKKNQK